MKLSEKIIRLRKGRGYRRRSWRSGWGYPGRRFPAGKAERHCPMPEICGKSAGCLRYRRTTCWMRNGKARRGRPLP